MFDISLSEIYAAWRGVAHVAEWTGLSVAGLVGCGAALYFAWQVSFVRHAAIAMIALIIAGYGGVMAGNHVGRSDARAECEAQKRADKERMDKAASARDSSIATITAKTFDPINDLLAKQDAARQIEITNAKPTGDCRIGASALRMRQPAQPKHN